MTRKKLAADDPRNTCARCRAKAAIVLTVVDVKGYEDAVCVGCWRECERAKQASVAA